MNFVKRLCLFLFGLAGIFCLVALVLPWVGPWTVGARAMIEVEWYRVLIATCLCITAVGLLWSIARAIFTPRKRKTILVTKVGADEVTVTTAAIASQAAHIVEADHTLFADKVSVKATGRGKARVAVRVHPSFAMDVTETGSRLHADLAEGLAKLCGDSIDSIALEVVEADSVEGAPAPDERPLADALPPAHVEATLPESSQGEPATTSEITVPMGHVAISDVDPTEGEVA